MNVFDLYATLSLDKSDYEAGLSDAESSANSFGSKLKSGLATAAKATGTALTVAGAAVGAIAKKSVDAYADFEQLSGGIETLFGESAQKVMADASEAFRTAGLSANEYMETSIQSAAALINSLEGDQEKAAELMNLSIVDMADNVNKMGTSMEAVQNAYRGFSRGNFTMLDNLALGFAGTKEGMEELLAKAQELSGVEYDIGSYSDIVKAIHVVQKEMGITGTTAKEASATISGSVGAMKSAFTNLVAGLADDNADIDALITNVVESAETAFNNLLPAFERAIMGVASLIEKLAPVIAERLPGLFEQLLPPLLNAAQSLLNGLVSAMPSILSALVGILPDLLVTISSLVDELVKALPVILQALTTILPDLIPIIVDVVLGIAEMLIDNIDLIVDAAIELMMGLAEGIVDALPLLIEKAPIIIEKLVQALIRNVPKLLEAAWQIIVKLGDGIVQNLPQITRAAADILKSLSSGLITGIKGLGTAIGQIIKTIKEPIDNIVKGALSWGKDMLDNFIGGIKEKVNAVKDAVKNVADKIKGFLGFSEPDEGPLSNFHTYAPDMMKLFTKGIKDSENMLYNQIKDTFDFGGMIQSATGPSNIGFAGAGSAGNDAKIVSLLEQLLNKDFVQISADADGIFNVVRRKNDEYFEKTGDYAFIGG